MKKILIVLLIIVIFSLNGFAQNYSWDHVLEYFRYDPAYMQVNKILDKYYDGKFIENNDKLNRFLNKYTYSFIDKNKLYMLSYNKCESCMKNIFNMDIGTEQRYLFLFRLDGNEWVKVSDIIRTDSIYHTTNTTNMNLYYPIRDGFGVNDCLGYMKKTNNIVEIRLTTYYTQTIRGIDNSHRVGTEIIKLKEKNNQYLVFDKFIEN